MHFRVLFPIQVVSHFTYNFSSTLEPHVHTLCLENDLLVLYEFYLKRNLLQRILANF